ncbi:MAG: NADH-quinone oxidoreductase subunit NuoE [Devosia sp.]|mgnify:CR=1 FL=1|uniref:NADH-quinone oxidoreductase subunit NuoE n=1 Tax=Devosia sp. 66-22 TaxID=1895753 RepID=UPI000928DCEB|nr:NADH-quinone oxidoreductase subunit NuoE [Devosia sp. 66-22]MBN9346091.1 NADH-quinone oxidoreductase subunit NuoE [Devosia sp.]OJX53682.1 MAG: NADH-quinone oxidoreductase subunit E [Devosia sp. 66-22]
MSVRRLADDAIQPAAFAFSSENQAWANKVIARYPAGRQQSAVIPILWRAQEQEGWVTRAAIEAVAKMLGMAYIRVLEVATFYTQFLLKPVGGQAHIIVCGTTPCMLRGAGDLIEVCKHKIAHDPLEVSADGTLSWEEAECMGACVNAPMIGIANDTYEDLTVERFEEIIEAFRSGNGKSIPVGTQAARRTSAAEGGQTTLLEAPTAERTYKAFPPPPPPAPAAAPAAPTPAAPPAPTPTAKGKGSEVVEENAPAVKGTPADAKVSEGKAEAERAKADAAAKANGEPNRAMREDATGAESPAGKVDGGKSTKKAPRRLFDAPVGPADDLKLIAGVGPVLEQTLNAIGITTYRQVAALTPEQIDAVEAEAGFKGRIARNNWLQQAEVLARGGVEEYRKVFGKDPK